MVGDGLFYEDTHLTGDTTTQPTPTTTTRDPPHQLLVLIYLFIYFGRKYPKKRTVTRDEEGAKNAKATLTKISTRTHHKQS